MGLLQGPRLMAWITKSPIRGNNWVPLGSRALLGSVKPTNLRFFFTKISDHFKADSNERSTEDTLAACLNTLLNWYCIFERQDI